MDDHNFFCALLCSACSTTCCCIAVWTVESNSDFLHPICRNRLCQYNTTQYNTISFFSIKHIQDAYLHVICRRFALSLIFRESCENECNFSANHIISKNCRLENLKGCVAQSIFASCSLLDQYFEVHVEIMQCFNYM